MNEKRRGVPAVFSFAWPPWLKLGDFSDALYGCEQGGCKNSGDKKGGDVGMLDPAPPCPLHAGFTLQ